MVRFWDDYEKIEKESLQGRKLDDFKRSAAVFFERVRKATQQKQLVPPRNMKELYASMKSEKEIKEKLPHFLQELATNVTLLTKASSRGKSIPAWLAAVKEMDKARAEKFDTWLSYTIYKDLKGYVATFSGKMLDRGVGNHGLLHRLWLSLLNGDEGLLMGVAAICFNVFDQAGLNKQWVASVEAACKYYGRE